MAFGTALKFLLIVLLALPFLLLAGTPWLVGAFLWWRWTRTRLSPWVRMLIAAALAACGVAPLFYAHGAIPIYFLLLSGDALEPIHVLSFLVTFVAFLPLIWVIGRIERGGAAPTVGSREQRGGGETHP